MVEIILRKDMQDYEAKPLFGFTYRQVATGAIIAVVACGLGLLTVRLGVPSTIQTLLILAVCGAIGLVGLGTFPGLRAEQWWRIWSEDRSWPRTVTFASPRISAASWRNAGKARKPTRKEKRAQKAAARQSALETESEDIEVVA